MDDTVMDFMLCQLVAIAVLREHVGLEVGDEGLEVGEHPLGRCPSTYAAHANKIVSEPYQKRAMFKNAMPKTQTSNCKRFNPLELPDKVDQSKARIGDSLNKRC